MVQAGVAVRGRLAAKWRAETGFLTAGFCPEQSSKRQKHQALRLAGGPDQLLLKKT
jgi:hypothetical protein